MKVVGVIPSRYGSSRLPGKPLEVIGNKTLIEHVVDNAKKSNLDDVYVLTDDKRIYEHIKGKCKVLMTSPDHESGTSRINEIVEKLDSDYIVNIQGDEPFLDPQTINKVIDSICGKYEIYSAYCKLNDYDEISNKNNVKVVCNREDEALYFSRSVIPYEKNKVEFYRKHIGMYVYSKKFIKNYENFVMSNLEKAESLEQLTFLYEGYKIKMFEISKHPIGIDTFEDLENAREYYEKNR